MNRLIDYKQGQAIHTGYHDAGIYRLDYLNNHALMVKRTPVDSGQLMLSIPFATATGMILPVQFTKDWIIDINDTGLNMSTNTGGRLDGMALQTDSWYILWAFADEKCDAIGFGISLVPTSTFTCDAALKGEIITISDLTNAYRFTTGARIRIERSNGEWNLATIISVSSPTQLTAIVDNDQVYGQVYGDDITAQAVLGGLISQLDMYRPYKPGLQECYHPYYSIIGFLPTDSSSPIEIDSFEAYPFTPSPIPVGAMVPWCTTIVAPWPTFDAGWRTADDSVCMVDRSPIIGQVLTDPGGLLLYIIRVR